MGSGLACGVAEASLGCIFGRSRFLASSLAQCIARYCTICTVNRTNKNYLVR